MQIERREKLKKRHVAWLEELISRTGMKAHKIAICAGIAPSTLYNVLNMDKTTVLNSDTIDRIVQEFDYVAPDTDGANTHTGFGEAEAVRLEPETVGKEMRPSHPGQSVWRIHTRALELPPYGLQPGEEVLIDDRVDATPHDIVCANTSDGRTVWRAYMPPFYLLTATADLTIAATPLVVGHDAAIMGTVVQRTWRRRP